MHQKVKSLNPRVKNSSHYGRPTLELCLNNLFPIAARLNIV